MALLDSPTPPAKSPLGNTPIVPSSLVTDELIGDRPPAADRPDFCCSPRLCAALQEFLKALDYAHDLRANAWDFAIELSWLRRLKLSNSDVRWMVGRGLVSYALETTAPGDVERSFTQPARLIFCKRTCFTLTPKGAALGREICASSGPYPHREDLETVEPPRLTLVAAVKAPVPKWDRDRQELRVGDVVVKRFRVPAASQEAILAAFEEENWPTRIDDPLPPRSDQSPKRRLQETIKSLNRNQKHALIRFQGDGSAQGVIWEYCGEEGTVRRKPR